MAKLGTHAGIDWTACELIEQIPDKVSGRPIVAVDRRRDRGTRIMPDDERMRRRHSESWLLTSNVLEGYQGR